MLTEASNQWPANGVGTPPISHKKINSTNNVNKLGLQQIQAQTWETLCKVPSYAMPGPPPLGNGIQM